MKSTIGKRYLMIEGDLRCPYCSAVIEVDLVNGGCPFCGGPINNSLAPVGLNCDNMECGYFDYYKGCLAKEFCDKRLHID